MFSSGGFRRPLTYAKDKVIETIDDCLNVTMELGAGDPELRVNGEFAPEFKQKNDGYTEVRLARQERRDMKGNFIDVIRGKGKLHCNAELGAATMVAIKLGVEAYRQRKSMVWDSEPEKGAS